MLGHVGELFRGRAGAATRLDITKHEIFRCLFFLAILQGICILHSLLHIFESPMVHVAATATLAVGWFAGMTYVVMTSLTLENLVQVEEKTK